MTCHIHPKLLSPGQIRGHRARWRARGQRVVFTNGCFDLLHRGHVDSLQAARQLGDLLVVGLNDDASVRRLKGPGRPLQPLEDRIIVLGAMTCVSWIIVFEGSSVEGLVEQLLPDVLVKGGDYAVQDVVGGAAVEAAGGSVVVTRHVPNTSTSDLLARLREVI